MTAVSRWRDKYKRTRPRKRGNPPRSRATLIDMKVDEILAASLSLDARSRARLARKLLASLEELSEEEKLRLWVEEAERRDAALDADPSSARPGADVLRDARSRLT